MFKIKKQVGWGVIFGISFFSLASFGVIASRLNGAGILATVAYANDDSDDKEEDEEEKDDDDEDDKEEKEKEEAKKKQIKKEKEAAKQKAEYQKELLKKKSEYQREQLKKNALIMKMKEEGDDKDEKENESKEQGEIEEKNAKKADILEDINEEIIDAEERIAEAQAEGIDATKALATLVFAREKAKVAEQTLSTISYEELRKIEREVKKLAHFASHKDVKSARDMEKDIDKVAKRIAQTKGKVALYESLGGNKDTFTNSLGSIENDFKAVQERLAKGGQEQAEALSELESLEKKVKAVKSSVESAIYALGGTDERYDDDYENEVEDIYEDLNDVAEIEGDELGNEIRRIAVEQKSSVKDVSKSVKAIDTRNQFLQALFGAKNADIEELESEIADNKVRISALTQVATTLEDPDIKKLILDQVVALEQENSKLETFVTGQKDRLSAFGWLKNLF